MSDYRMRLAIAFAERLADTGTPAMRACKLAAAVYGMGEDAVLIAWLQQLLFSLPGPLRGSAVKAAHS